MRGCRATKSARSPKKRLNARQAMQLQITVVHNDVKKQFHRLAYDDLMNPAFPEAALQSHKTSKIAENARKKHP
jgi:hypothetical protein